MLCIAAIQTRGCISTSEACATVSPRPRLEYGQERQLGRAKFCLAHEATWQYCVRLGLRISGRRAQASSNAHLVIILTSARCHRPAYSACCRDGARMADKFWSCTACIPQASSGSSKLSSMVEVGPGAPCTDHPLIMRRHCVRSGCLARAKQAVRTQVRQHVSASA